MEKRTITCIPLAKNSDQVFKISYVTILSSDTMESIKLPTNFESYKYSHMIRPDYLLTLELVKTRKNWILKNILNYEKLQSPATYTDYLKQTELTQIILKHLYQDQETDILHHIVNVFKKTQLANINPKAFEKNLTQSLGFIS